MDTDPQNTNNELNELEEPGNAARRVLGSLATSARAKGREAIAFGLVTAVAATGAGAAKASSSHAERGGTPAAATSSQENSPVIQRVEKEISKCMKEANSSKAPNVFFGAIYIPTTYDGHGHGAIHMGPAKRLSERGLSDPDSASPKVLVNPTIAECNGRLYALAYNRGDVSMREAMDGTAQSYDWMAQDAITDGSKLITHMLFVDLGEASKMNGGRLLYYGWDNKQPQMAPSMVRDGRRVINGSRAKFPNYAENDGIWYGFHLTSSVDPGDPITAGNYINSKPLKHFINYQPPFQKQIEKAAAEKTY